MEGGGAQKQAARRLESHQVTLGLQTRGVGGARSERR